ncbi:hypothetical protein [Sphingobacterium siyangense]|uniref:hypothetical protein n=1 Tax=Sphingobacterium siyangense TaxID=459529 RepID=UPI003DA53FD6
MNKLGLLLYLTVLQLSIGICYLHGQEKSAYTVEAYIWPSCHHDARFGNMLWPDKTGEWEVIKKGTPRFEGHYQPKQPL